MDDARAKAESGSGWYAVVARTGLVAKGVSFGIDGVLAIRLALGDGGKATSREGALQSLAHQSSGKVLLISLPRCLDERGGTGKRRGASRAITTRLNTAR